MTLSAYTIHTYTRYYGKWRQATYVEFMTDADFIHSEISRNTHLLNKFSEEHGHLTHEFMNSLIRSGNDPIFPQVRTNGGYKVFTEEEYKEAKGRVSNSQKDRENVIDVKGLLTTVEAEFDRAMIYESVSDAKKLIQVYEQYQKDSKRLDSLLKKLDL